MRPNGGVVMVVHLLTYLYVYTSAAHVTLPAVKIVDLRHVSKENVLLAAEDWRQEPGQSWVVHLSPVPLQ